MFINVGSYFEKAPRRELLGGSLTQWKTLHMWDTIYNYYTPLHNKSSSRLFCNNSVVQLGNAA